MFAIFTQVYSTKTRISEKSTEVGTLNFKRFLNTKPQRTQTCHLTFTKVLLPLWMEAVNDCSKSFDFHVDSLLRSFSKVCHKLKSKLNSIYFCFPFCLRNSSVFRYRVPVNMFNWVESSRTVASEKVRSTNYEWKRSWNNKSNKSSPAVVESLRIKTRPRGTCLGFNLKYQQTLTTAGMVGS